MTEINSLELETLLRHVHHELKRSRGTNQWDLRGAVRLVACRLESPGSTVEDRESAIYCALNPHMEDTDGKQLALDSVSGDTSLQKVLTAINEARRPICDRLRQAGDKALGDLPNS